MTVKKLVIHGMPPGIEGPHGGVICNDAGCVACDPARERMKRWAHLKAKTSARRRLVR